MYSKLQYHKLIGVIFRVPQFSLEDSKHQPVRPIKIYRKVWAPHLASLISLRVGNKPFCRYYPHQRKLSTVLRGKKKWGCLNAAKPKKLWCLSHLMVFLHKKWACRRKKNFSFSVILCPFFLNHLHICDHFCAEILECLSISSLSLMTTHFEWSENLSNPCILCHCIVDGQFNEWLIGYK